MDDRGYDKKHSKRGIALIINNQHFDDKQTARRLGSEADVKSMQQVWYNLGFDIVVKRDKSAKEIETILYKYANKDHSDNEYFVCVVMSHGDEQGIEGVDGEIVNYANIVNPFKEARSLHGKPKLFFIQACRGDLLASPIDSKQILTSDTTVAADKSINTDSRRLPEKKVLDEVNILVHFSTVHGYAALRKSSGSFFIQSLAQTLYEKANQDHLNDILIKVNEKVAEFFRSQNLTQVPEIISRLNGKVYLKTKWDETRFENFIREYKRLFYIKPIAKYQVEYEGDINKSLPHGKGRIMLNGKKAYEGNLRRGEPDGDGEIYYVHIDQIEETSTLNMSNEDTGKLIYKGEFKKGQINNTGTWYYSNGRLAYEGEWKDGNENGQGKGYSPYGQLEYEGEWKNGKANGQGKWYYPNGRLKYEGEWKDGNENGQGKWYYPNGQIAHEREWGLFSGFVNFFN